MFAHIILASASTASSKMSAKHQENDTPVKASHLLLVIAVCQVLVPEHCLLGEPPQAREICVVPQEQCGVVTLCDLPKAEGQGTTPQNRRMPLSKAAWHMVNPSTSLRHWQQLVTAGSPVSVRGNGM